MIAVSGIKVKQLIKGVKVKESFKCYSLFSIEGQLCTFS